ncbi:ABC transporter permease [Microbacterium halophytorum]|uniref:ABC transporter permease n=1 Tax=Microbacterium halophytorum TaxID=2067568 RepID=UPI000CFB8D54|nr:ABC transporter permease [Microbacterium halophytorum]
MTVRARSGAHGVREYLRSLWLVSARDLKVRYSTSWLGYLWSVLDPLVMSAIYWFVFTQVFQRGVGQEPYILFLISALLPWVWFNTSISDFTRAFQIDAKLVRSTAIPRSIWVARTVLSKGVEFLLSLPVLLIFIVVAGITQGWGVVSIGWGVLWIPVAVALQALLLLGLGLIIAPLCVLFRDLERTAKLVLRALFYASPIIYGIGDLPDGFGWLEYANPLAGLFALYRAGFFPEQLVAGPVISAAVIAVALFLIGMRVMRALERPILKEL